MGYPNLQNLKFYEKFSDFKFFTIFMIFLQRSRSVKLRFVEILMRPAYGSFPDLFLEILCLAIFFVCNITSCPDQRQHMFYNPPFMQILKKQNAKPLFLSFFLLQTLSSSLTGLWGPIWNALATFDCKLKTVRGKSFAAHSATRINLDNARKCGVSEARRGAHKIIISLKPTRKPCENNAKNDETLPSLCERTRRFLGGVFPEALILSQRAEVKCRNQLKTRRFRKNARKSIK